MQKHCNAPGHFRLLADSARPLSGSGNAEVKAQHKHAAIMSARARKE